MKKTLIFGHKNPDTDTITSAIAYAQLKEQLGVDVEPVRLGELNLETEYALNYFNVDAPRLVENVSEETDQVILVDHNEFQQSANDIENVQILEVIDHHRVGNFETKDPLYMRLEPVGCTATILLKLYKEHDLTVKKEVAGLMLSAIISDTLLFKSPTCTDEDVKAAHELAEIAGVNVEEYGLEMLKAGADLSAKSTEELISLDAKEFSMGNSKVEIAQVNTVDTADLLKRETDIKQAMTNTIERKGLHLFVFAITNILTNDSTVIALGDETNKVEAAFNVKLENDQALLKGVVSRKKQIVPPLTEAFTN